MLSLLATGYIKADHWIGEFVIKDENIIPAQADPCDGKTGKKIRDDQKRQKGSHFA